MAERFDRYDSELEYERGEWWGERIAILIALVSVLIRRTWRRFKLFVF